MVMVVSPKKNERIVKGEQCDLAKDPLMVKSVFFLKHKNGKLWMVKPTSGEKDLLHL